jgi:uncharacterized protein
VRFSVAQLLKESVGATREYTLDETFAPLVPDTPVRWVRGWVRCTRTHRGIWVSGRLETSLPQGCSRCLQEFEQHLSFSFDEEYLPTVNVLTGAPLPSPGLEEGALAINGHHELDLNEGVRQYAISHLPIKLLCQPGCRGLCAGCGANLNDAGCLCKVEGEYQEGNLRYLLSAQEPGN